MIKNAKHKFEIVKKFKISQIQVSKIKRKAAKFKEEWWKNLNLDRKRKECQILIVFTVKIIENCFRKVEFEKCRKWNTGWWNNNLWFWW